MTQAPGTRQCPYPDCPRHISDDEFACKQHWVTLPQQLRADITDNYRRAEQLVRAGAMREAADHWVANGALQ